MQAHQLVVFLRRQGRQPAIELSLPRLPVEGQSLQHVEVLVPESAQIDAWTPSLL
ncbi:MAG: hypothetical protein WBA46_15445 [Thermomicrobiales bacterium]